MTWGGCPSLYLRGVLSPWAERRTFAEPTGRRWEGAPRTEAVSQFPAASLRKGPHELQVHVLGPHLRLPRRIPLLQLPGLQG